MKKRILSLVLCAAMLLSMCLFLGAGVVDDASDTPAESTAAAESTSGAPAFQSVGPFMTYFPGGEDSASARKAPMLRTASANDASGGASDAVQVDKTATATDKKDSAGNPIYKIDLNAQAKSNIVSHSKACDIVLVLDRSGSMNYSLSGRDNNSKERVKALQESVNAFLTEIQKSSPNSRVAIVTYASDATIDSGTKTAAGALVSVTDSADSGKVNSALTAIVTGLSNRCTGGTQSGKGMQQAVNIFNSVATTDENYDNTRVTVLFTDGKPGDSIWGSDLFTSATGQGYDVAQQSVHWSAILKHAKGNAFSIQKNVEEQDFFSQKFDWGKYGVSNSSDFKKGSAGKNDWTWTGCGSTVYCVGLGLTASNGKNSDGCKINEYLYRVSSHRPDGSHVTSSTIYNSWESDQSDWSGMYTDDLTRNHPNGYYLTTDNKEELKKIFTNIAEQTGEAVKDVTIRDEISESFVPCDENGTVYTVGQTITSNGQTGTVKQDESGNYYIEWTKVTLQPEQIDSAGEVTEAAKTFSGTLYVKPKDGFLGGNNVPTNGTGSGVYTESGEQVKLFPQPEVNVPLDIGVFDGQIKNIYYLNDAPTLPDLSASEPLEPWQTAYVNIAYQSDKDVSNTQDGTYTVTMTVSPNTDGQGADGEVAVEKTNTVTSTVYVYKPEITYKDSVINLGETANYENDNFVGTVWKHGEQTSTDAGVIMVGTAPELTFAYDPEAAAFTQETYVKVTVKIGDTNITDAVQFKHEDCSFTNCSFDAKMGQFIVHINVFDLTIVKTTKNGSTIDPNQTFVFKVKNNETNQTMEVVITGEGEKTIKNLPMGSYTITEDTNWSWQYKPTANDQRVTTDDIQNGVATVSFENEKKPNNWLTSLAEVINSWVQNTVTQTKVWPEN